MIFDRSISHRAANIGYDYDDRGLPMVFGTETEFALTYGKALNEGKSSEFPVNVPERVFPVILKIVAEKNNAFVRNPENPWLRKELNHFESDDVGKIIEAIISNDFFRLPVKIKDKLDNTKISLRDFFTGQVGIFLPNGSRLYIDGSHLESSICECREPLEVICYEKAMDQILAEAIPDAEEICGREILILKDNTDRRGHSYGYHENFSLRREFFRRIYTCEDRNWSEAWLSFIITSIIYNGSGKIGSEDPAFNDCDYQISQRSDFFNRTWGLDTMDCRPLINSRDEPLADKSKWGRLHVILDDATMSEWSTYLKIGTKALVLNMLQHLFLEGDDGRRYKDLFIIDPVKTFKSISRDLTCKKCLVGLRGAESLVSALKVQKEWLALVKNFYSLSRDYRAVWIPEFIDNWSNVLEWIEEDNANLNSMLDWRIKKCFLESVISKHATKGKVLTYQDDRIRGLEELYHNIKPEGFYNIFVKNGFVERLINDSEIDKAKKSPPEKTRAWGRGQFINKWLSHLCDVSWELILFELELGDFKSLARIDIEPLNWTESKIGGLFRSDSWEDFCRKFVEHRLNDKSPL